MTKHAFLFESRSIQRFIFAGGKLRDIVSASNLIDQLTGDDLRESVSSKEATNSILDDVLQTLGITDVVRFSRRAGGAFYAVSSDADAINRFAQLWPLVVSGFAPGLEILTTQASGDSDFAAVSNGLAKLKVLRNFPVPQFPIVPPVAQRAQRTGEGAVINYDVFPGNASTKEIPDKLKSEIISKSTAIKRRYARKSATEKDEGVRRTLARKFTPGNTGAPVWPKSLSMEEGLKKHEVLPLVEGNNYVALVHIDGNGLGQLLIKLNQVAGDANEAYAELYLAISRAIASATQDAATAAVETVLKPVSGNTLPAIPLVLGGDDITIIVAAKYALAFAESYMREFEHLSSERFKDIQQQFPQQKTICAALPDYLSACAGIVFCKATYPFQYASDLAEELCKKAKKTTSPFKNDDKKQPQPGGLCWHKVTTTSISSADDIFERELTYQRLPVKETPGKGAAEQPIESETDETPVHHYLSLGTYVIDDEHKVLPRLSAFLALQDKVLGLSTTVNSDTDAATNHDDSNELAASKLGKLRDYVGYLKSNPVQAEQILSRLWETDGEFLGEVMGHLRAIWPQHELIDAFTYQTDTGSQSLLADLIASASLADLDSRQGG